MRTLTKTVHCPICEQAALLTLYEHVDPANGAHDQQFTFTCTDSRHLLTEGQMLETWAAEQKDSPPPRSEHRPTRRRRSMDAGVDVRQRHGAPPSYLLLVPSDPREFNVPNEMPRSEEQKRRDELERQRTKDESRRQPDSPDDDVAEMHELKRDLDRPDAPT